MPQQSTSASQCCVMLLAVTCMFIVSACGTGLPEHYTSQAPAAWNRLYSGSWTMRDSLALKSRCLYLRCSHGPRLIALQLSETSLGFSQADMRPDCCPDAVCIDTLVHASKILHHTQLPSKQTQGLPHTSAWVIIYTLACSMVHVLQLALDFSLLHLHVLAQLRLDLHFLRACRQAAAAAIVCQLTCTHTTCHCTQHISQPSQQLHSQLPPAACRGAVTAGGVACTQAAAEQGGSQGGS